MKTRNQFGNLLVKKGLNGIGVEVGVERGFFSNKLLQTSKLKTLISVDKWSSKRFDHMREALKLLAKHESRSICIRGESREVSLLFQDEIFDFVYIDAAHYLEAIKEDLLCWWPKLKYGGLFAGHDYMECTWGNEVFGVIEAVDEFVEEHNLNLLLTQGDWKSWYCFKPPKMISLL